MSILATRLPKRALIALTALAAAVTLLGTSAAPASAGVVCEYKIIKYGPGIEEWGEVCRYVPDETEGNRDLDISS
jgi:hypothetical protein